MGRKPLSDEEKKERKRERNQAYYEKTITTASDGSKQTYSDFLTSKSVKQLRINIDIAYYDAVKEHCDQHGLTIKDYIMSLIQADLGL